MKIVVAITAASGGIYARLTLERLLRSSEVSQIALVCSAHAREVLAHEDVVLPEDGRIRLFGNDDLFAPPASGSARYDAMVVVPSTVGTVGRVAAGAAQSLIERAADVMLKERRRLVFVVRETPLSLIHLRNMTALTEAGAVILLRFTPGRRTSRPSAARSPTAPWRCSASMRSTMNGANRNLRIFFVTLRPRKTSKQNTLWQLQLTSRSVCASNWMARPSRSWISST